MVDKSRARAKGGAGLGLALCRKIAQAHGGELKFESVTTGASNDIERATDIARKMVTMYGMSDRFGLMGLSTVESQYLSGNRVAQCSDRTEAEVDAEVMQIIADSYEEAKKLLSENRQVLDRIAAFLIEKETITGKEFMEIFHATRKELGFETEEEKKEEPAAESDNN